MEFRELLQPPPPTPSEEMCQCSGARPVKLMTACALGYNPIHCIDCNREVAPETLKLTEDIIRGIAYWRQLYSSIDCLWLDSGAYEEWATGQLSDIHSPVNRLGREIAGELNSLRRCYYWLFQDQSTDGFEPTANCPVCYQAFLQYADHPFAQSLCENCSIITV